MRSHSPGITGLRGRSLPRVPRQGQGGIREGSGEEEFGQRPHMCLTRGRRLRDTMNNHEAKDSVCRTQGAGQRSPGYSWIVTPLITICNIWVHSSAYGDPGKLSLHLPAESGAPLLHAHLGLLRNSRASTHCCCRAIRSNLSPQNS